MNIDDRLLAFSFILLPLFASAGVLVAKAFTKGALRDSLEKLFAFIGLGLPWAAVFLLAPQMLSGRIVEGIIGGWDSAIGISYRFDQLSLLVNILGYAIAGPAWLYSLSCGPRNPSFTAVFLIQTSALAATIMTSDLFNLFVALEVMGIASYVLIASSHKPGAVMASFSYLMVSATAMVFFLVGLYGLYRLTGSLSYAGISEGLSGITEDQRLLVASSFALIIAAVAMRTAVMPLYGWLPDAHAKAPHAVSAVLSGVLIKTPLFALTRVLMILPLSMRSGELLAYAGSITALAAVILALSQKDAKQLLAYHSISQIGYVVSAWGLAVLYGTTTGTGILLLSAAFIHAFYHALFKGLLFLSVGSTVDAADQRDVYRLRSAGSYLRKAGDRGGLTLICFFIGALSISAIPPFNGFASKNIISYALKGSLHYPLLFIAAVGTVASFIKLSMIFLPAKNKSVSGESTTPKKIGFYALLSQLILALLCITTGLLSPRIFDIVYRGLSGGTGGYSISVYTSDTLSKTLIITSLGALLSILVLKSPLGNLLHRIGSHPRSFSGLFTALIASSALLTFYLVM